MSTLSDNFHNLMPLNRKERFYTGTVLPGIICSEKFRYLNRFLQLIPGFQEELRITPDPGRNNIIFQTEYSFKESLVEEHHRETFQGTFQTKDTPDLVILITEPELYLFVCEAKVFSNCAPSELQQQLMNQEWFIDTMTENLQITPDHCFHFALVPEKSLPNKAMITYPVVYWEEVLAAYHDLQNHEYFFNVLMIAMEKYDALRSFSGNQSLSYGKNMEKKLTGLQIVELLKQGKNFFVGRNGGLYGDKLQTDIETGGWKSFPYEVNTSVASPPNRNWFSAIDFVKAIKENSMEESIDTNNTSTQNLLGQEMDEWHFSHLGEEYFLEMAQTAGCGRTWDAKIKTVYIGKTGKAYKAKLFGRDVKPNWSVILEDNRKYKYGQATKYKLENGLFDTSSCKQYLWSEIRDYFLNHKRS